MDSRTKEHPKARGYDVPLRLAALTFLSRRPSYADYPDMSQACNAVHPAESGNGIAWQQEPVVCIARFMLFPGQGVLLPGVILAGGHVYQQQDLLAEA